MESELIHVLFKLRAHVSATSAGLPECTRAAIERMMEALEPLVSENASRQDRRAAFELLTDSLRDTPGLEEIQQLAGVRIIKPPPEVQASTAPVTGQTSGHGTPNTMVQQIRDLVRRKDGTAGAADAQTSASGGEATASRH